MKRVLIITYYWPPSGGGGVMRWLKMSKYLPEYGWQPVICTPDNPDPSVVDESLAGEVPPETEVLRLPIWEPYDLYRKITGKAKSTRFKAGYISEASGGNWKERLSVFIRGNLLIPDPRVFWVRPTIRFLKKYLAAHPVDLIISTGPPHSMHLVALGLRKSMEIPWLADFRDPWTGIDFYHRLKLTFLADQIHHSLEKKVLQKADVVTVVTPGMKKELEAISGRSVELITNGFDPADFNMGERKKPELFLMAHFGALNADRNPRALWKALGRMAREDSSFKEALKIRLVGQTDENILSDLKAEGIENQVELLPHKEHREGLDWLSKACLLLLPLNDTPNARAILPGKMYEYIALGRPVLAIGPAESDCEAILKETQAGFYHYFDDADAIRNTIASVYDRVKRGEEVITTENTEQFSRRVLAGKIIELAVKPH